MTIEPKPRDLPNTLTPAQRLKCEVYLDYSLRWHNSYERIGGILKAGLPADIFLACLGYEWSMCDNIVTGGFTLRCHLAMATRRQLNLMMSDEELAQWKKLPDTLTIYRFCYNNNMIGYSYTLSREVAENFSTCQRYQQGKDKHKYIITASIPTKYTVLKLGRNEQEIIAIRLGKVKIIEKHRVTKEELESIHIRIRKEQEEEHAKIMLKNL